MYIQEPKILGVFVSDVGASGFRASGGLEPSKNAFGWAGSPWLGLDTSLAETHVIEVIIKNFLVSENLYNVIVLYK